MTNARDEVLGPDFAEGILRGELREGLPLLGHVRGQPVVLVRTAGQVYAVGAACTHYGGPLAEGIVAGHTLRCPWHHACFDLRTGEAVRAPAFAPIECYQVVVKDGRIRVGERLFPTIARRVVGKAPSSIVIVGAGAAGHAAADTLRRERFTGAVTLIGAEATGPVDRPNLSKDYLAGKAPEDWIPLAIPRDVELRTGTSVTEIDPARRHVRLADGSVVGWDALLLAMGAEPVRLEVPGSDLPHVHTLRTLADSKAIIEDARRAKRAVVVGAGFIGLEVAAALRERGVGVEVVAPVSPLRKVLGPDAASFLERLHQEHGVVFHIGEGIASISQGAVRLTDGSSLPADLVVVGIGVRPATALAERAGLRVDRGIVVDERLSTSIPGVYAAGDVARWPDPRFGGAIRVEHWVVAQRMGAAAARSMLGLQSAFGDVPFFWSAHYDAVFGYVGHAERWDRIDIHGNLGARDATLAYREGELTRAVATIGRDWTNLEAELAFEYDDQAALAEFGKSR